MRTEGSPHTHSRVELLEAANAGLRAANLMYRERLSHQQAAIEAAHHDLTQVPMLNLNERAKHYVGSAYIRLAGLIHDGDVETDEQ